MITTRFPDRAKDVAKFVATAVLPSARFGLVITRVAMPCQEIWAERLVRRVRYASATEGSASCRSVK